MTLLPYTVCRLDNSAAYNNDAVNHPGLGTCFEGWDVHFSITNHLAEPIFVYSEAGKFLKEIPVQRFSVPTATVTNGATINWETMTDVAKTAHRSMRRENSSMVLYPQDLRDTPVLIAELGIVITIGRNRTKIVKAEEQLQDLLFGRTVAMVNGQPQYPDAMIMYGNFPGDATPIFYLSINDAIIQIYGRHTDLMPENTGVCFIDEDQGGGRFIRRMMHYSKANIRGDDDGVYENLTTITNNKLPQPANYVLSDDYQLLVTYLEKMRKRREEEDGFERVPSTNKLVATPPEVEEIIAQKVRVCTEELTQRTQKAEAQCAAVVEELAISKKQTAELEKERKTLLTYVERSTNAETIDQRFLEREEERELKKKEQALNQQKAKLDMTQKTVGIAAASFSLLALFTNPLKSFFSWLGSKLGFVAAAVV